MDPSNICDFNDLLGVFRQAFAFQEIIDLSSGWKQPETAWYPAGGSQAGWLSLESLENLQVFARFLWNVGNVGFQSIVGRIPVEYFYSWFSNSVFLVGST